MIRASLLAGLVALVATAASATPYPGTISRAQDNADQMTVSMVRAEPSAGLMGDGPQIFGAPQDMRGALATETPAFRPQSSIRMNFGTSSDRFQDNANVGR